MVTVRSYFHILLLGDSTVGGTADQNNTSWPVCTGGLIAQINALLGTTQVGRPSARSAGLRISSGGVPAFVHGGAPVVVNRGQAGWATTQIEADKANIPQFAPDLIVIGIGVNDAVNGVVTPAQSKTNMDTALAYYAANITPAPQIMMVEPFLWKEQWTSVGPALNNAHDAAIDATSAQIQASCVAAGGTWVPTRAAALAYEVANNTPEPGATFGYLMDSQFIHPTYPTSQIGGPLSGMELIANQAMLGVTVTP